MKNAYYPVDITCGECGETLVLSVELMEYIEDNMVVSDPTFEGEIDSIIHNNFKHLVKMAPVPFVLSLNLEFQGLSFLGWCQRCNTARISTITPKELSHLLDSANTDDKESRQT